MDNTITDLPHVNSCSQHTKTTTELGVTKQNIRILAQKGFTQLQQVLGKNNINTGDVLIAFNNEDGKDKDALTNYFCLAITMLDMNKEELDKISDDIFNKLFNYVVSEFNNKL